MLQWQISLSSGVNMTYYTRLALQCLTMASAILPRSVCKILTPEKTEKKNICLNFGTASALTYVATAARVPHKGAKAQFYGGIMPSSLWLTTWKKISQMIDTPRWLLNSEPSFYGCLESEGWPQKAICSSSTTETGWLMHHCKLLQSPTWVWQNF